MCSIVIWSRSLLSDSLLCVESPVFRAPHTLRSQRGHGYTMRDAVLIFVRPPAPSSSRRVPRPGRSPEFESVVAPRVSPWQRVVLRPAARRRSGTRTGKTRFPFGEEQGADVGSSSSSPGSRRRHGRGPDGRRRRVWSPEGTREAQDALAGRRR